MHMSWTDFKALVSGKKLAMQYRTENGFYVIFAIESSLEYGCDIEIETPASSNQEDFEDNYKDDCNKPLQPCTDDGKTYVRAESRPLNSTTYFTMRGDNVGVGDGTVLAWDFSNSNDIITGAPTGFKRKRIEFTFIDWTYLKEGTLYWHNAPKGCYVDFLVVCPTGGYYQKNDGSVAQATSDIVTAKFLVHHLIQGDCPMGDEMNTECCSNQIPSYMKFWIDVTTPTTDTTSNGKVQIEIYRERTHVV